MSEHEVFCDNTNWVKTYMTYLSIMTPAILYLTHESLEIFCPIRIGYTKRLHIFCHTFLLYRHIFSLSRKFTTHACVSPIWIVVGPLENIPRDSLYLLRE